MSPYVSPRYIAERRRRIRGIFVGIAVEGLFALSLLGVGYLICVLAAGA
jgi:hypothetical protein